jgi:predicted enzyme related to lactoylglutathione lyase
MKRVTGIGGIFFKSEDPDKLYQWYETHLGIRRSPDGTGAAFEWREVHDSQKNNHQEDDSARSDAAENGMTVWSILPRSTKYFDPSRSGFMINYRVDDLDALLEALKQEGVQIDPHREDYDYGRFAWIMDPEGNRVELWEPPKK